ncbi:chemotaxis protein CheD [Candidatus Peregrinibacteria bacterium]|nr:chemotaxis protein CheD [Candidatus Peregrinibacteria bacterium]
MPETINVEMADLAVSANQEILKTSGVGSCLVVTLYDPVNKIGGMAHAMLPKDTTNEQGTPESFRFVDDAINEMISRITEKGGKIDNLRAKLVGGAKMFSLLADDEEGIGEQNISSAKETLNEKGISIESEDIGGTIGRRVEFNVGTGLVSVSTKM